MNDIATVPQTGAGEEKKRGTLVEKHWDPITRIVGNLGIFTKIDFENREVAECYSTSSVFRGYSVFMKGKDPRDLHFITSRICGICGDNHATCSVYAQNMAYGIKPPPMGEWIINLGEAAEYMFDHNIFQDNMVGVDFCERMVKETNPCCLGQSRENGSAARRRSRLSHDRRYHDCAQPVHRRILPRDIGHEPADARDVQPDGRPPHPPFDPLSGRCRDGAVEPVVHRVLNSADDLCRIHEKMSCRYTTISSISFMRLCPATKK